MSTDATPAAAVAVRLSKWTNVKTYELWTNVICCFSLSIPTSLGTKEMMLLMMIAIIILLNDDDYMEILSILYGNWIKVVCFLGNIILYFVNDWSVNARMYAYMCKWGRMRCVCEWGLCLRQTFTKIFMKNKFHGNLNTLLGEWAPRAGIKVNLVCPDSQRYLPNNILNLTKRKKIKWTRCTTTVKAERQKITKNMQYKSTKKGNKKT